VSAAERTPRDARRRRLGQNFLRPDLAEDLVSRAAFDLADLVVEFGAGRGAFTFALARRGLRVIALEKDPHWAAHLRREVRRRGVHNVTVVCGDALAFRLPSRPFRVVGSIPFARTTAILRRLLDDPRGGLVRADLVVQWEVARKRAVTPPTSMLSTTWVPWWSFRAGRRIPAAAFRPVPAVDAAVLEVTRRTPPLLPDGLALPYAAFVRSNWDTVVRGRRQ
jgi:23S rRNA (adenine-N6)-dimethyltransferase